MVVSTHVMSPEGDNRPPAVRVLPRQLGRQSTAERHQHQHAATAHDLDGLVSAVDLVGRGGGPQLVDRLRERQAGGVLVTRIPVGVHARVGQAQGIGCRRRLPRDLDATIGAADREPVPARTQRAHRRAQCALGGVAPAAHQDAELVAPQPER